MDRPQAQPSKDGDAQTRVLLFDAHGEDRPVADARKLDLARLQEHELAWIDIRAHDAAAVEGAMRESGLDTPSVAPLFDAEADPLFVHDGWYAMRAIAPHWDGERGEVSGAPWLLIVGPNVVVTAHEDPIDFLDDVIARHDPRSRVGELDADIFAVVLLDRMLTAYFDALDMFEDRLDALEVAILEQHAGGRGKMQHLRQSRRAASMFRRLLSGHRDLFDALRRPDFRPDQDERDAARFRAVSERYERAMDAVENARDLVVGSYELLSTRLSHRTNETMRLLTFFTVLLGTLAVVAGVLGMNFQAELFESGSAGFWMTVGTMVAVVAAALLLARWRGWWK